MRPLILPVVLACLGFGVGSRSFAAATADPLPTQEEIHQTFEEGKYPLVLQKLQRVLTLKGNAAKPYDRHDLLRLRGETHLRMKAATPAAQAFTEAAQEAPDPTAAAEDRGTALLVKRSQQQAYTPKAAGKAKPAKVPDPIPITDKDSRKKALSALFEDELAASESRVKAAREARQLPAILNAMPTIRDLRSVELAATGKDERTKELVGQLGTHAHGLMADAVKDIDKLVAAIEKSANQSIRVDQMTRDPAMQGGLRMEQRYRKRGIDRKDTAALKDATTNLEKIAVACRDMADALGDSAADFGAVRSDAGKVAERANRVLNEDYRQTYTRPPSGS